MMLATASFVSALDNRSRETIERLTTDTARAVAQFLYDRDLDILLAANIEPGEEQYQNFLYQGSEVSNVMGSGNCIQMKAN